MVCMASYYVLLGLFFLKISTDSKASESLRKYEICQKSKSLLFGSIANANVQDIQKLIQFAMGKITSKTVWKLDQ